MALLTPVGTTRGHTAADRHDALLLGRFIARARADAGLTQTALAHRLGTRQTTVSEWERGASKPDISLWPRIAHELGVDPHDMAAVLWGPRTDGGDPTDIDDLIAELAVRAKQLQARAARAHHDGRSADEGA